MMSDAVHRARQPRSLRQRVDLCSTQRVGPSASSPPRLLSPRVPCRVARHSLPVCSARRIPTQAPSAMRAPPPSVPSGSLGSQARTTWAPRPSPSPAPPAGPHSSRTAVPATAGASAGPQTAPLPTSRPARHSPASSSLPARPSRTLRQLALLPHHSGGHVVPLHRCTLR